MLLNTTLGSVVSVHKLPDALGHVTIEQICFGLYLFLSLCRRLLRGIPVSTSFQSHHFNDTCLLGKQVPSCDVAPLPRTDHPGRSNQGVICTPLFCQPRALWTIARKSSLQRYNDIVSKILRFGSCVRRYRPSCFKISVSVFHLIWMVSYHR